MAVLKLKHPKGGQVIVPPLTWVSDIASVLQNGFDPVFVDIDLRTLGMETQAIIDKLPRQHVQFFYPIFRVLMP